MKSLIITAMCYIYNMSDYEHVCIMYCVHNVLCVMQCVHVVCVVCILCVVCVLCVMCDCCVCSVYTIFVTCLCYTILGSMEEKCLLLKSQDTHLISILNMLGRLLTPKEVNKHTHHHKQHNHPSSQTAQSRILNS